jgi:hypothetical protein
MPSVGRPKYRGERAAAQGAPAFLCVVRLRHWGALDKSPAIWQYGWSETNCYGGPDMALDAHLVELSEKHRALDRKIEEELARPTADDLVIADLKRQKLRLKDEIERLKQPPTH